MWWLLNALYFTVLRLHACSPLIHSLELILKILRGGECKRLSKESAEYYKIGDCPEISTNFCDISADDCGHLSWGLVIRNPELIGIQECLLHNEFRGNSVSCLCCANAQHIVSFRHFLVIDWLGTSVNLLHHRVCLVFVLVFRIVSEF
jgi:hypothetical protein